MFATGRAPNTTRPDIGLKNAGVELDSAGAIKVDKVLENEHSPAFTPLERDQPHQLDSGSFNGRHGIC